MQYITQSILNKLVRLNDLLQIERFMRTDRLSVKPAPGANESIDKADYDSKRPWKLIPSASSFKVELAPFDWLLLLFGLKRRYKPTVKLVNWKNGSANRYINYMFKRLRKQVTLKLYDEASYTMWYLMRSHSYQVSALNYVARGWYKNMRWSNVKKVLRQVKGLARNKATSIDFKRCYIAKDNGKIRPLGVPTLAWRIYLHMFNNILVQWRMVSESDHQHAYLPGRGILTAWAMLLNRIDYAPNIYEADLKGFFDNVTHKGIREELDKMGIPGYDIDFIDTLNKTLVKLTPEDQIPEPERNIPFTSAGELNEQSFAHLFGNLLVKTPDDEGNWNSPRAPRLVDILPPKPPKVESIVTTIDDLLADLENPEPIEPKTNTQRMVAWDNQPYVDPSLLPPLIRYKGVLYEPDELIQVRSKELEDDLLSITMVKDIVKTEGVPQGAPTSCSLATLAWRPLERAHPGKLLLYADDAILFPSFPEAHPPDAINLKYYGLTCNEEKSRWAKRDGVWLVDYVKFLGLKYYPASYTSTIIEDLGYPTLLFLFIDVLLIGFPLLALVWIYVVYKGRTRRHEPRFEAATRNGATLAFGDRESFISFLNNSRTWLLNSSATQTLSGQSLKAFLAEKFERWASLHNPVKLINDTSLSIAYGTKPRPKDAGQSVKWPHIPLFGFWVARMMNNSWESSIKQDFRLKPSKGSWCRDQWKKYRIEHELNRKALNTFTASSFACHGLLTFCKNKYKRKGK